MSIFNVSTGKCMIAGGVLAAMALPFLLPAGAVAAAGGAIAAGIGAVGGAIAAGAGAVGAAIAAGAGIVAAGVGAAASAIAGLGAGAAAAMAAIGGVKLIGGITIALVLKWGGAIFAIAMIADAAAENGRAEGIKEGYEKASKEYAAKLRKQAKVFFTQIAELQEDIVSMRLQRDEAQDLAIRAFRLTGEFEGCISGLKEKEQEIDADTAGYYMQLKKFIDEHAYTKTA